MLALSVALGFAGALGFVGAGSACGPSPAVFAERMNELTQLKAELDASNKRALSSVADLERRLADLERQNRELRTRLSLPVSPPPAPLSPSSPP